MGAELSTIADDLSCIECRKKRSPHAPVLVQPPRFPGVMPSPASAIAETSTSRATQVLALRAALNASQYTEKTNPREMFTTEKRRGSRGAGHMERRREARRQAQKAIADELDDYLPPELTEEKRDRQIRTSLADEAEELANELWGTPRDTMPPQSGRQPSEYARSIGRKLGVGAMLSACAPANPRYGRRLDLDDEPRVCKQTTIPPPLLARPTPASSIRVTAEESEESNELLAELREEGFPTTPILSKLAKAETDSSMARRESLLANLTAIEHSFEASDGTNEQLTKLSISANLLARRCCATGAACSHAEAAAAFAKYEGHVEKALKFLLRQSSAAAA